MPRSAQNSVTFVSGLSVIACCTLLVGKVRKSSLFRDPTNANEKAAGIADGELISTPRFRVWSSVFNDEFPNSVGHCVHVFDVKVQAKWIVLDIRRPPLNICQV